MSIRQATPVDVLQVEALVKSLAHFYLDNPAAKLPDWLEATLTRQAFSDRISSLEYVNFVSEEEGTVVGYIALKRPGHLYHLFVSERHQGKGIARLLWRHLVETFDCREFTVRSSRYAVPVYKRLGFSESGPMGNKEGVAFQPMRWKR